MITEKIQKNGERVIMVRFSYNNKTYPVKNFTKLFGSRTKAQAREKLVEVKHKLSMGIADPFKKKGTTINDLYAEYKNSMEQSRKWSTRTADQYDRYYERNIKPIIGGTIIQKVTYQDLKKIVSNLAHGSISHQNKLKNILAPIFDEAIRDNIILDNPLVHIKNKMSTSKAPISDRVLNDNLFIAKELYRCIPKYRTKMKYREEETRAFFLLLLLTAHRYGELCELTKDNVFADTIISPGEITKTGKPSKFPIPEECRDYINSVQSGKLFPNIVYGSILGMFRKIVKTTNIQLINNEKLTPHDTRRLFMSVLVQNHADIILVDQCLDHSLRGVMKHYLSITHEQKVEIFEQYWSLLRA